MAKIGIVLFFWGGAALLLIFRPPWDPFITLTLFGILLFIGFIMVLSDDFCPNCGRGNFKTLSKKYVGESTSSINQWADNIRADYELKVKCNHCGTTWSKKEHKNIGHTGYKGRKTYDKDWDPNDPD